VSSNLFNPYSDTGQANLAVVCRIFEKELRRAAPPEAKVFPEPLANWALPVTPGGGLTDVALISLGVGLFVLQPAEGYLLAHFVMDYRGGRTPSTGCRRRRPS
jgi:hypothetical protein